jgi:CTP:molybdopterin cytidylyltransferase MocA
MSETPFRFGCILLAAGASTRMGRPKQLLPVAGQPLVARAAEAALASPAWPVVVVLGAHAAEIHPALARLPVLIAENAAWAEGLGSSIRAGLAALEKFSRTLDAALIALADQPAFSADAVARLVAAHRTNNSGLTAARYAGRLGVPALFARKHFSLLHALRGDEGARAILAAHAGQVTAVDLPELALDLDTPADYEKFCPASPAFNLRADSSADSTSGPRTVK